jgi:probable rRNA maturation factor
MTLRVAVSADGAGVRVPVSRARVAELARAVLRAEGAGPALLSLTFIAPRAIAALNRRHLGRSGPTDVIAFGFARASAGDPIVGDIYIAPAVARLQARRLGVPVREEVARLVIHGTLHVLGYEHPEGADRTASRMWKRQEQLLARAWRRREGKVRRTNGRTDRVA